MENLQPTETLFDFTPLKIINIILSFISYENLIEFENFYGDIDWISIFINKYNITDRTLTEKLCKNIIKFENILENVHINGVSVRKLYNNGEYISLEDVPDTATK